MLGNTWIGGYSFSTVNFMKSTYRLSISQENLASKSWCTITIKNIPDSEDFRQKNANFSLMICHIDCMLKL